MTHKVLDNGKVVYHPLLKDIQTTCIKVKGRVTMHKSEYGSFYVMDGERVVYGGDSEKEARSIFRSFT